MLNWKSNNAASPTVENYDAQESYYQKLWQQNQDAIVNGLGNGTIKQGSDEWYELFKKGDDLLAMKDAYNRGMMGQLDGDKALTESEKLADTITTRVRQGWRIKENI